jgi:hypothetical protein
MSEKKPKNKLAEMTALISGSLEAAGAPPPGGYEYSTAYLAPKAKQIFGTWKVIEHTIDGNPYPDVFCAGTFRGIPAANVQYDATYEFSAGLCVKRLRMYGELEVSGNTSVFDYRMNVALSWELKPGFILALPVLGYQYTSLDGKPAAVKDLPRANEWMRLAVRFEYDYMVLEDGSDIKTLARVDS